ncbi:hypothetical protein HIM_04896 [Hirsutella minnesotensis 3608]|uniref:Uncharacterized protein n=1 Tax=Hirsutella minnesotensis 3608 TaxID=1043627 RepID=A0A0F8A5Q5_9HYPO|nr:hypothetical protein HIM_04896 [Hirsutella minnesotensis 3608]
MDAQQMIGQSRPVDVSQPYDASGLRGKTVVLTGGANGLGAAMACAWAALGAHLAVGDVDDAAGEALVAELRRRHPDCACLYQHCDVTDWEQQVALFDAAVRMSPRAAVDIVVPNAGILLAAEGIRFEEPVAQADGAATAAPARPNTAVLDVNVVGVAYTAHLALHHLARNPSPDRCLLLVGSFASLAPLPGQAQYTMSKHAVAGLFRSLRSTASIRHGIRVNMVAPAIWECYAHDYDQVETFVWRYLRMLNAVALARGYLAWLRDVLAIALRKR